MKGEVINLYKDIAPEEGTLQELIEDKTHIDNKKMRIKQRIIDEIINKTLCFTIIYNLTRKEK